MCSENLLMQSFPLYNLSGSLMFPSVNLDLMHHPDSVWMLTPQVEDTRGLGSGPDIGSNIESKSAYIMKEDLY